MSRQITTPRGVANDAVREPGFLSGDLYLGASPDAIKAVPRCAGRVEGGDGDALNGAVLGDGDLARHGVGTP